MNEFIYPVQPLPPKSLVPHSPLPPDLALAFPYLEYPLCPDANVLNFILSLPPSILSIQPLVIQYPLPYHHHPSLSVSLSPLTSPQIHTGSTTSTVQCCSENYVLEC